MYPFYYARQQSLYSVCIVWTRNDPPVVVLISSMLLNMVSQGVGLLIRSVHRQMHTADTLLKPLKQDAVHRCIYMAYLKKRRVHLGGPSRLSHLPKRMRCKKKAHSPVGLLPGESPNNRIPLNPARSGMCRGCALQGQSVEFAVQCFCRRTVIN